MNDTEHRSHHSRPQATHNDTEHRPPALQALRLHRRSRLLELEYAGKETFRLRCEYLRA